MNNHREIKFRAWDTKKKEMIDQDNLIFSDTNCGEDSILDKVLSKEDWYKEYKDMYILMQYTGLKDKNGKEIYEGDIVKGEGDENNEVGVIEYGVHNCSCCSGVYGFSVRSEGYTSADIRDSEDMIVVGNIYENPELLK